MKNLLHVAASLFIVVSAGSICGKPMDPMWLFSESATNPLFSNFRYCDTARGGDYLCVEYPDYFAEGTSSDAYNGSVFLKFPYKFSSDSLIIRNEFDQNIILYRDLRPGFAGFKTAWDMGMTGFPVARYKYLVLVHKGPNADHRVKVNMWYNNGACGAASYKEEIGTFNGSTEWKPDTIVIPDNLQNKPDLERNTSVYYEMVFIINNVDPNNKTPGQDGILSIDDIRLVGRNPIDTSPKPLDLSDGQSATFSVVTSIVDPADVLTYQWKKDGAAIAAATGKVYTIPSVKSGDAGVYTAAVTVSSTNLTFASSGAALTLKDEKKSCGCGSGTGLAFIPPLIFKAMARRKKSKKAA